MYLGWSEERCQKYVEARARIDKLENDVCDLNNQIKNFNKEKKSINELHKKEVNELKDIIRKLYIVTRTIQKSIDLKKTNKRRVNLLEKMRKNIQNNTGFKKTVDEIMSKNNTDIEIDFEEDNTKLSNIIKNINNGIINPKNITNNLSYDVNINNLRGINKNNTESINTRNTETNTYSINSCNEN